MQSAESHTTAWTESPLSTLISGLGSVRSDSASGEDFVVSWQVVTFPQAVAIFHGSSECCQMASSGRQCLDSQPVFHTMRPVLNLFEF